jgi:hypothetical protein
MQVKMQEMEVRCVNIGKREKEVEERAVAVGVREKEVGVREVSVARREAGVGKASGRIEGRVVKVEEVKHVVLGSRKENAVV